MNLLHVFSIDLNDEGSDTTGHHSSNAAWHMKKNLSKIIEVKYSKPFFYFSFLLLACLITHAQSRNELDVVRTTAGSVSGTANKEGDVHIFKGIPFAAPPVGDLRWKAPQPVVSW